MVLSAAQSNSVESAQGNRRVWAEDRNAPGSLRSQITVTFLPWCHAKVLQASNVVKARPLALKHSLMANLNKAD